MSDNDKKDLTRIEDLSEFLHSEDDDDLSDVEAALSSDDSPPDVPADDQFADMATDPDINIPDGFNDQPEEVTDFTALEDSEETFTEEETSFEEPTEDHQNFESNDKFDSSDDNFESNDEFENTDDNFESNDEFENSDDNFESNDEFENADDNFESNDEFESNEDNFESNDEFESTDDNFESNDDFESTQDNLESNDEFESPDDDFESNDEFENSDEQEESLPALPEEDSSIAEEAFEEEYTSEEIIEESPIEHEVEASIIEGPLQEEPATVFGDSPKTSLPVMEESDAYKSPENFKELQQFARNMSFGNMAKEGNPPFSIILKDIKFEEDLEDIIRLLVEYKIIDNDDRDTARSSLERGNMLIPRLGEFAAISLCHKLRRFDINILMGLTEEVNPAKDYESDDRGLTTKNNIYNNKQHNWKFEKQDIQLSDVIVSTTPYIDGHDILEYISIVTESTSIDMNDYTNKGQLEEEINIEIQKEQIQTNDFYPFKKETEKSNSQVSLNDIYKSLVEKCKAHAINKKGNALIGVNFQITPLLLDDAINVHSRYQITCSGSVVWINKR